MYKSLRLLLLILLGLNLGASAQTVNFTTPGGPYAYTVPAGVTGITVNVQGARGGINSDPGSYSDRAGHGGCVQAVITVTPGQVLQVYVGGCGGNGTATAGGTGGINGGGDGSHGISIYSGGGGGGASDIRTGAGTPVDRIVVGAGGGGAGIFCGGDADRGGDGGAAVGEDGFGCGAYSGGGGGDPATFSGGIPGVCGGCTGSAGTPGTPTDGGDGGPGSAGGGGGGGYYGGGGGWWTGGGGGANYAGGPGVSVISDVRGCNLGCGSVAITVSCTAGSISGVDVMCERSSTSLTATVPGGSWSVGLPGTGVATITPGGVITGVTAGLVTVTYQFAPGVPGCRAVKTMSINPLPPIVAPDSVLCDSFTLAFSSPMTGGVWTSSNILVATVGSSTGIVLGRGTGVATITYTLPTGCFSTQRVTVNALPAILMGPGEVCATSSITLTSATPGGTWSWTATSTGASIILAAGAITGVAAGTVDVCYTTVTGCTRCREITVNPLPASITGPSNTCIGVTSTYSSADPGGTWSNSPTTFGTINATTGDFTPTGSTFGITTITYTLPTGCYRTRPVTINVVPAPIGGLNTVCHLSSTTLTNTSGTSTWSSSSTAIATVGSSTGSVFGVSPGVVTITFTMGSSCFVTHTMTVNPRPDTILGPDPICEGSCVTYTTTSTTGTWSSTLPLIGTIDAFSGIYCALSSGSGTIRYTLPTGCMREKTFVVNPLPAAIVGDSVVCEGSTIVLSSGSSGGTWSSTDAPGIVTLSGSLVVRGENPGIATITYTLPTTCATTKSVTVLAAPDPIVGADTVCQEDSVLLTNATGGGTWSSSIPLIGSIANPSVGWVKGIAGGLVTISYTLANGCYSTLPMEVNGLPTLFGPRSMCISDASVTVTASGGAGVWTAGPPVGVVTMTDLGAGAGSISPVSVGTVTICYTRTPSGCAACDTFTVNPAPSPISGPSFVCVGRTITMNATPSGGTWTAPNTDVNLTIGAGTGVVLGVAPGVDTIVYTVGTGCSVTDIITVLASPASITGSLNVCVGLSTVLNDATPGGRWTNSNPAVGTATPLFPTFSQSVTVTGIAAGTTTLTYTLSNGCYADATVTVNSTLAPIGGPTSVCVGSAITLSVTATPAGTWSSGSTGIATVTAGPSTTTTVTGVAPGTSLITFASPTGCGQSTTITVNPTPVPIITPLGSLDLCPGGVVALTATTGVGYTYQWRNAAGIIIGATNSTFVTGTANTYRVTVTLGPCSATSPPVIVTMNPVLAAVTPGGTINTCASTPPTLSATPTGAGISYQWQLGGSPIPGEVASTHLATVSGTYTAIVTNGFGCSATSNSVIVNLAAAPVATMTVSGPLSFCSGGSVTMTTVAGTGYTYQWFLGGLPIAGATNRSHTASLAGSYYVVVYNTGCNDTSATTVVATTPGPPASITVGGGGTIICAGSATLLFVTAGPYTYQWYKNTVLIPGATNASYAVTTTGSYHIVVTDPVGGCNTTSATRLVTVVPVPTVNPMSATSFCWGGSVNLTAIVGPGAGTVTYQWVKNGVDIPGATNASFLATTTGLYAVRIMLINGCTMTAPALSVTQHPLPNPLVTLVGAFFNTGTFVTYQWYKNSVPIAGATNSSVHHLGAGSYKVIVTDVNGCQSASASYVLTTPPPPTIGSPSLGLETTNGGDIKIYPNPAQNTLHIEYAEPVRVVISSMDGRTVIDRSATNEVDLAGLADGIYMVKLFSAGGQVLKTEKLVKASQ